MDGGFGLGNSLGWVGVWVGWQEKTISRFQQKRALVILRNLILLFNRKNINGPENATDSAILVVRRPA